MPTRNQILTDISNSLSTQPNIAVNDYLDNLRHQFIGELSDYTGRNTISYYSAFMTKPVINNDINDSDMAGFMTATHGLDYKKGLDLILHTPGGSPTASESIVKYLRKMFDNDIRVIVPHMAMSAGTMIACSAKEIIMGNQSSLGPIDPQFGGIPAYNIKAEFMEAENDIEANPQKAPYWALRLQKYDRAFLRTAIDAISLSNVLVSDWLGTSMFNKEVDEQKIKSIVEKLNEHEDSLVHDRHFDVDKCEDIGLKIVRLEDEQELQEKVLTIHHSMMITFDALTPHKIIENQINSYILNVQ